MIFLLAVSYTLFTVDIEVEALAKFETREKCESVGRQIMDSESGPHNYVCLDFSELYKREL